MSETMVWEPTEYESGRYWVGKCDDGCWAAMGNGQPLGDNYFATKELAFAACQKHKESHNG